MNTKPRRNVINTLLSFSIMARRCGGRLLHTAFPYFVTLRTKNIHKTHYATFNNITSSMVKVLHTKLKDAHISCMYPLKELVALCSEEDEPELLSDVKDELLALYKMLCIDVTNYDNTTHKRLKYNFETVLLELLSKDFSMQDGFEHLILEVKAGVGGEEANRFATELFNMYKVTSYDRGFGFETVGSGVAQVNGGSEFFKYEVGVHRVQRIPINCKRIQTSSAVVTIAPHISVGNVKLQRSELMIETMRSRGAGGQSVNKSETAVRITHLPTGISVQVQDTSSQISNKTRALQLITERIADQHTAKFEQRRIQTKISQYKSGDRSERIRTFQFVHDSVTDHRCGVSVLGVESFLQYGCGIEQIHNALRSIDDSKVIHFVIENLDEIIKYFSLK